MRSGLNRRPTAYKRRSPQAPGVPTSTNRHLVALHHLGGHTSAELAELFSVARSTVYRAIERSAATVTAEPMGMVGP